MKNDVTRMDAAKRGLPMCGKFCVVRSMNKAPAGEYVEIL